MAFIVVPRPYPSPAKWDDRVRNGKAPDWRTPFLAGSRGNFALSHCRKLLFHKTTNAASPPQSQAGTVTPWRWHCGTGAGYNSDDTVRIRGSALMLPAANGSATDPYYVMNIGATASTEGHYSFIDTTPSYDQLEIVDVHADVAADTQFECSVDIVDYARVVALTVWEEAPGSPEIGQQQTIDTTLFAVGNQITDAQHENLSSALHTVWKHGGTQFFSLVPDSASTFWTRTTASYVNILDNASTSVSANTPGYNIAARYHSPRHTDSVVCVFAAYAYTDSAGGTGNVKFRDDNGTDLVTLNISGNTPAWYTGTANIDGSVGTVKADVWFQGDGTNETTVEAASCYPWVA